MTHDKQLEVVRLEAVVEKRLLGQALNAKEFAVLAGISYSAARDWFRTPGFPVFRNHVCWQDFTDWRRGQIGVTDGCDESALARRLEGPKEAGASLRNLPPNAAQILREIG